MNKRKLKIILAIDGGGIRGVFPLLIIHHIEELLKKHQLGNSISPHIDLISGTSTGAIISTGLIVKRENQYLYSSEELLALYRFRGPQLFNLTNPAHEKSDGLRLVLKRKFKNILLSDLDTEYALVSFDKSTNEPYIFQRHNHELSNLELSTALAACSAIPGYFPSVKIKELDLVDGIMAAKNPSSIAYQHANKCFPDSDLLLLSFGTGQLTGEYYDEMEEAVDQVHDSLLQESKDNPKLNYFRFQPEINEAHPAMDNASSENIEALVSDGIHYIEKNKALFEELMQLWKKTL